MAARPAPAPARRPAAPATPQRPEPARQDVATRKPGGAVMEAVPDFMKGLQGQGVENVGQSDIETPRIKLLQSVSPECEQFNEAKPGHFWHSIAERDLDTSLRIVPLYIDIRAILWRPRHEGGGILARADDGIHWNIPDGEWQVRPYKDGKKVVTWRTRPTVAASGLLEWGSADPEDPNSQPAATRMYNMACALPDFPDLGIGVVTLQRASIRVARKFTGKLKLMAAPAYGCYFTMASVKDQNPQGDVFNNFSFTADGFVKSQEEFETYKGLYERFKQMGLQIKDLESAQDEGVGGEDRGGGHDDAPAKGRPAY